MKPFSTIADLVRQLETYSNPRALNYQLVDGWDSVSSESFVEDVKNLALGLRSLGIKKGDMVGILSNSSPQWTIADLAIMMAGAVTVPLFGNISDENFEYEIKQTNIKFLFIAGEEQWEIFSRHSDRFDVVVSLRNEAHAKGTLNYDELIDRGKALDEREPQLYEQLRNSIQPGDLASIVYTSGSTGFPKGAMLTHKNLTALLHIDPFGWDNTKDVFLSVLPLAHIFARAINFGNLAWGVSIYYLSDVTTMASVCKEIRPTFTILVPRILEKIYAKMVYKVERSDPVKRFLGKWAINLANKEKQDYSWYDKLFYPVAEKLVYSKFLEALGGNFRFIVSGGSSLNPQINRFFLNIGLPLYEGWGLTEAATVCCAPYGHAKIGTVGKPFEGMQVKIGPESEILVKGPIVMQGYYKNEEATRQVFLRDGWLRTGDKGTIDEDGYLTVQGRLKELYKTSTGEYIAPVPIEQELSKVPLIDMAMVIGEGKKFASCLLFPDFEVMRRLKRTHKMETMSDEEFLNSPYITAEVGGQLEKINKHLNHWEEVHAFRFIPQKPSIDGGELTPTMKIRRDVVLEKYRQLIESIYEKETV